jgi:hypothetical protein
VIDAINLYFGGALFDTCEKFFAYYAFTEKMKTHHVPEDILLKGISFTNLHNIAVVKSEGIVFNPKLTNVFDSDIISEIVDFSKNPAADLGHFFDERVIIQYTGFWEGLSDGKPNEDPYSHAACLAKYKGELFLLDCAENGAINLTRDPELTRSFLHTLEYINMFEVEELRPDPSVVEAIGSVFDRIYNGEPSRIRGGYKRVSGATKKRLHKTDRAQSAVAEHKPRGKQASQSTLPRTK